jgi:hypothetical protein
MTWKIFSAGAIGGSHRLRNLAYQDAHKTYVDSEMVVGFLTDGCGSGKRSEIGAGLGVDFLVRRSVTLLRKGLGLDQLGKVLFVDLVDYLGTILNASGLADVQQIGGYVNDYLLFTALGLVATSDEIGVLSCGDGVIGFGDDMIYLDQDNKPSYPAYVLIKNQIQRSPEVLADRFRTWKLKTDSVSLLTLASDAFQDRNDLLLEASKCSSSNQLQMKLNKWTVIEDLLDDDATVVVARKE